MELPADPGAEAVGLFWMQRLNEPPAAQVEPGLAATFLRIGPEEGGELAAAMDFADVTPVLQRFERGCHCYIARVEGRLVSYGWVTFDKEGIGSLGLNVRLLPGEAYIWDCATLAPYRGRHLYPALLIHIVRELRAAGFQRAWIGMDASNRPSLAGVVRAGFQPVVAILQVNHAPVRTFLVRGYSGVSLHDVQDAQYALLGSRSADRIALPETSS